MPIDLLASENIADTTYDGHLLRFTIMLLEGYNGKFIQQQYTGGIMASEKGGERRPERG